MGSHSQASWAQLPHKDGAASKAARQKLAMLGCQPSFLYHWSQTGLSSGSTVQLCTPVYSLYSLYCSTQPQLKCIKYTNQKNMENSENSELS